MVFRQSAECKVRAKPPVSNALDCPWFLSRCLLLVVCIIWSLDTKAASVELSTISCKGDDCATAQLTRIHMRGEIEPGDADRVLQAIMEAGPSTFALSIRSPGGDVIEAMKIGRLARKYLLNTNVSTISEIGSQRYLDTCAAGDIPGFSDYSFSATPEALPECACDSACFFVFVGGVQRSGNFLGIHRPYFDPAYFSGLSVSEADQKYQEMLQYVESYLVEMGVSKKYFERMLRVSSSDIEYLSINDVKNELGGYTPSVDEWLRGQCDHLSEADDEAWVDAMMRKDTEASSRYTKKLLRSVTCDRNALFAERKKLF